MNLYNRIAQATGTVGTGNIRLTGPGAEYDALKAHSSIAEAMATGELSFGDETLFTVLEGDNFANIRGKILDAGAGDIDLQVLETFEKKEGGQRSVAPATPLTLGGQAKVALSPLAQAFQDVLRAGQTLTETLAISTVGAALTASAAGATSFELDNTLAGTGASFLADVDSTRITSRLGSPLGLGAGGQPDQLVLNADGTLTAANAVGIGASPATRKLEVTETSGSATVAALRNIASASSQIAFLGSTGVNDYDVRAGAVDANVFGIYTNNTLAVSWDASQNATFAGAINSTGSSFTGGVSSGVASGFIMRLNGWNGTAAVPNSIVGLGVSGGGLRFDIDGNLGQMLLEVGAATFAGSVKVGAVASSAQLGLKSAGINTVGYSLENAANANRIYEVRTDAANNAVVGIKNNAGTEQITLNGATGNITAGGQLISGGAIQATGSISNIGGSVTFMDVNAGVHRVGAYNWGTSTWEDLNLNSGALVLGGVAKGYNATFISDVLGLGRLAIGGSTLQGSSIATFNATAVLNKVVIDQTAVGASPTLYLRNAVDANPGVIQFPNNGLDFVNASATSVVSWSSAGDLNTFGRIYMSVGTEAAPAVASRTTPNTGLWFPASQEAALSTNGVKRWHQTNTLLTVSTLIKAMSGLSAEATSGVVSTFNRKTTSGTITDYQYGGVTVGSVSTDGTSTSFNTTSDYRLKRVHDTMQAANDNGLTALDVVLGLNPVWYDFTADGSRQFGGFLAHELQQFIPAAVTGQKDEIDAFGQAVYQAVDHSKITPYLVAAVQNLHARISDLETQLSNAA